MRKEFAKSASIFDEYEELFRQFKSASYLDNVEEQGNYVHSYELEKLVIKLIEKLDQFLEFSQHKKIKDAKTYLENGVTEIIAYKKTIEHLIFEKFGAAHQDTVLSFICPIIEYLHRYHRAHDNKAEKAYWAKKIASLRSNFRKFPFINQEEIDNAINITWTIGQKVNKSDSYVEAVNSVIRAHLNTYKSIPNWFPNLFSFYWNHRRFERGKRATCTPYELLSGKNQDNDWIEAILAKFPFHKFRSEIGRAHV